MRTARHSEGHLSHRSNWLRAGVLGANDGIVSTSSLVLGVAASGASSGAILTAGVAGLVAGALSMAAGEFVSVSSQRDSERADLRLEQRELRADPEGELGELARIYEKRGVPRELARQVAVALTERDALAAHARDELGLERERRARPLQASWASALAFSAGAVLPVISVAVAPAGARAVVCVAVTLVAPPSRIVESNLARDCSPRCDGRRWRAPKSPAPDWTSAASPRAFSAQNALQDA